MFEGGGGGKGVQGVIKHHNSVSLPRVKERHRRREGGGGDERISHFHVRERRKEGEMGGEKINKASLQVLHSSYFITSAAECLLLCVLL